MLAAESHLAFYLIHFTEPSFLVLFYMSDMWIKLCNRNLIEKNNSRIHGVVHMDHGLQPFSQVLLQCTGCVKVVGTFQNAVGWVQMWIGI